MLQRGDTIGIFQFEGGAMRNLVRALAPTDFEDVAALNALYRPGPMAANMHNDYADRKNGRKPVTYQHPDMEEVLGDTYGLCVYQEQMMLLAQKFAGYSLAEADNLRKAAGKKVREIMAAEREKFEAGCEATGYGRAIGKMLFDIIEPFADYGFNRSHAFGYGLVSYQTAWLKANYPAEYLAALLTSVKDDKDKTAVYLAECRAPGHRGAGSRRQRVAAPSSRPSSEADPTGDGPTGGGRSRTSDPLRAVGHPQRRRGAGRADHRRTDQGRPIRRLLRLLRPGRPIGAQQAHASSRSSRPAPSTPSATPGRACAWCSSRSSTAPWPAGARPTRGS